MLPSGLGAARTRGQAVIMEASPAASASIASRKLRKSCNARRSCKKKIASPTPPSPPALRPKSGSAAPARIDPNFLRRVLEKAEPVESTKRRVQLERVNERVAEGDIEPENFDLVIEDVKAVPRQHKGGSQAGIQPIGWRILAT